MRKIAILPFFGGTSEEAHSDIDKRLEYLLQTVASLPQFETIIYVQNARDKADATGACPNSVVVEINAEPKFLPYEAVKHFMLDPKCDSDDIILLSEADHSYTIADTAFSLLDSDNYMSPIRCEEIYGEIGKERGPLITIDGQTYVMPNMGAHDGMVRAFGGAIMCRYSAFARIEWIKSDTLAVEHITGFSAYRSLKVVQGFSFWCKHLSGKDYHAKIWREKYGVQNYTNK